MNDEGVELLSRIRRFDRDAEPASDAGCSLKDGLSDLFDAARDLLDIERDIEPKDISRPDNGAL